MIGVVWAIADLVPKMASQSKSRLHILMLTAQPIAALKKDRAIALAKGENDDDRNAVVVRLEASMAGSEMLYISRGRNVIANVKCRYLAVSHLFPPASANRIEAAKKLLKPDIPANLYQLVRCCGSARRLGQI